MEFENQINRYPGCKHCQVVAKAKASIQNNPAYDGKHIKLTHCAPETHFLGIGNRAIMLAMHIEATRLKQLNAMKANVFDADLLRIDTSGNCLPLIEEKRARSANITNRRPGVETD